MPGRPRLPRATPESLGLASGAVIGLLDDAAAAGLELHSLMVAVRGEVVAEGWWAPYERERPQALYSLSKSVTATAVGFAVAEGLVGLDDAVVDHFPAEAPEHPDANLAAMRVRHLLTMTTGHDTDASEATFRGPNWAAAFLALPVEHAPGSHFVYNTAATYMLAAIVQRVTNQRVLDYLTPRLFEPLGIEGATWEQSPQGIDTGGFGLAMTTEDIACFAELYRCDGRWSGRQVLPVGWAAQASARHTPSASPVSGPDAQPDWWQGYGYQLWRGRHGTYRGDGAFGQFAVVLPDQQSVVAITAGAENMGGVLELVWTHLLPALPTSPETEPLTDDAPASALAERLASLRLSPPAHAGVPALAAGVSGRPITFEPNALGVASAVVIVDGAGLRLDVRLPGGGVGLDAGYGSWTPGEVPRPAADDGSRPDPRADVADRVASAAGWSASGALVVAVQLVGSPHGLRLTAHLDGPEVRVAVDVNARFGPTHLADLVGRIT